MTSEILKKYYIEDKMVSYSGNFYRIKDIIYWIDRSNKKWMVSPRLIDMNKNCIVQAKLEDVEEIK